jgi:DNA-binding MarR family transcriptional regulator
MVFSRKLDKLLACQAEPFDRLRINSAKHLYPESETLRSRKNAPSHRPEAVSLREGDMISVLEKAMPPLYKILDKVKHFIYDGNMSRNQERIEKIRSFNRFYTNIIGLLDQHFLDTPFSLTEGRVLYEISYIEECSAKKIRENVAIDEGYLSRIIDKFVKKGLITKTRSPEDRRLHLIVLTKKGQEEFSRLNENQNRLITQITERLSGQENAELVQIMERMQELLAKDKK